MKIIYGLILFLFLCLYTYADKLEKGFEKLRAYDFFSAKEYFEKTLEDETPAAAYGLSVIFSSDKNPFYNPDSARRYILLSDSTYKLIKEKTKKVYSELGVTDSTIRSLNDFICDDAFNVSRKGDSVAGYNHYLEYFTSCVQYSEAISLRNSAAFSAARRINTSIAYKEFMTLYPQSLQYGQAVSKYEELLFSESTSDSTIDSYEKFILNYPENTYRNQAEKMLFLLTVPDKSLKQYETYVRKYKNGLYKEDSWREVYKLFMIDFSEGTFNKFKELYPDYPFAEELESDFRLQNYVFLPFKEEKGWGYINELGDEMIEPMYDDVSLFSDGLAVVMENGKYGYINKAGKVVIDFRFQDAESFNNGSAVVKKDSLYGLINKNGEYLVHPKYDELSEVDDDIFMVVKNDNAGYVLRNGDTLTGLVFDLASEFRNGYAIVNKKEKFGLLNAGGYFNIEPKYAELVFIGNGLLKALTEDEVWGIINVQGDTILPFSYDAIGEYNEHRALVAKNGKCGYVNEKGEIVIPLKFFYSSTMLTTGQFLNGFALLKQKYKSVVIDTIGKTLTIPGVEDYGRPLNGFIPVKKNKKWGFADMNKKIKISYKFEEVEPFHEGFAIIKQNKLTGIIDTTGNFFITPLYESITVTESALLVRSNGKSGLLSRQGILFIPCLYDKIEFISPKIARASDLEGYTYVNLESGKIIYNSKK